MATDLPPLGKYQPLAQIGSGGFAVVYRALDTSLEREVALKILKPKYLGDPEFVERFFREARTVARLAHPGIIAIYDVDTIDGRAYIAMELAAGSLGDRLAAGPLPWAEALALLRPICEALD
jgi:serine/threonine protein kinase